jgi:hypothetical protein
MAIKTLMWATFAKEHLQEKALLHALALKDDSTDIQESDLANTEKVISLCVGLVVLDRENSEIRLVHETTQQYFQKYFRDVAKVDGDAEIAMTCLRYFSFPAFCCHFRDIESMERHLDMYTLSTYALRYCFVHIRERRLEEKFYQVIVKTFENQSTLDTVYQLREHLSNNLQYRSDSLKSPRDVHLLHLASLDGLQILCREILRKANMRQRMYFLDLKPLI